MRLTIAMLSLLALLAFGFTGSASADVLCEDSPHFIPKEEGSKEGEEACSSPYSVEGEFNAKGSTATFSAVGGKEFEVKCASSLTGATSKDLGAGKGLEGSVKSLTFSSCTGACSGAKAINLSYKTSLTATAGGNGTLSLASAGSGNPGIEFSGCSLFKLGCTYSAESLSFAFHGSEMATLEAAKKPMKKIAGSESCPSEGTETIAETLQQPGGGRAYSAAAAVKPTVLCSTDAEKPKCAAGNQYMATEVIKEKVVAPGVKLEWNGVVRDTCTTSEIKIKMKTKAAPMLGELESWNFSNCTCTTKAAPTRLPWALSIERFAGPNDSGLLNLGAGGNGSPVLETLGCGGVNCNYVEETGMTLSLRGSATSPTMSLTGKTFVELGGGCGDLRLDSAQFEVESPLPLYVERAP
jgi:hypothetical protein